MPFFARKFALSLAVIILPFYSLALAQHQHDEEDGSTHRAGLHFSHPMITESPSPDTKVRLDFAHEKWDDETLNMSNQIALEAEYAFRPGFSVEVSVPYVFLDPAASNVGDMEIGLKFALNTFTERGFLLSGGLEFGLPTGNAEKCIGGEHFEIEPFVALAYLYGRLETVGFVHVGVPTSHEEDHPTETELATNLSLLYHLTPSLQTLLEYDNQVIMSGEENEVIGHLAPGLKVRPFSSAPSLMLGLAYIIPITTHKEFESHTRISMFYHF